VCELVHQDAILAPGRLGGVYDDEVSAADSERKTRPFVGAFTEKVLEIARRNSIDVTGMPYGDVVVRGDVHGGKWIDWCAAEDAPKLDRSSFTL